MLDFFKSLFRAEPPSSTTAKERLRLVLLSDHLSLAPEVVEALKRDLLDVISRYVEIDPAHADVTFEQREREVAMLASIPITGVRDRPLPPQEPVVPTAVAAAPAAPAQVATASVADDVAFADPASAEPALPLAMAAQSEAPRPPRRRRRRKKANGNAAAPSANKLATGSA